MLMERATTICRNALIIACISLATIAGFAQDRQSQPVDAIEGLDPVLLAQGKEVQGELKIAAVRGRFRYLFASEENKAVFEKDPARYEIQVDGHCARMGPPVRGNADLFAVHQGRIYIFGTEECKKRFAAAPEKHLESENKPETNAGSTPAALKRGQELISEAVKAMGGAARIDGLTSYREKSRSAESRGQGDVEVKNDLLLAFPDRIRLDQAMPEYRDPSVIGHQATILLPNDAFFTGPRGVFPMPGGFRQQQQSEIDRKPISILRGRKSAEFIAAAIGAAKIGEATVEQVRIEFGGANFVLGLDPATGRILSLSQRRRGPAGAFGQFVQTFSDYRNVNGLTLPFKVTATFDGQPWKDQSLTIDEITINGAVDPALFERPKSK